MTERELASIQAEVRELRRRLTRAEEDIQEIKRTEDARARRFSDAVSGMQKHVESTIRAELEKQRQILEGDVKRVSDLLERIEKSGNVSKFEQFSAIFADERNVTLLREAVDEQIAARVERQRRQQKAQESLSDLDIAEKRTKPFIAKLSATQLVVAIVVAIVSIFAALAALSHH